MSGLVQVRTSCRLCGSMRLERSVKLADVPIISPNVCLDKAPAESGIAKETAPLDNFLCLDCGLIQLTHVVDPALIYRNYLYRTTVSVGLPEHFQALADAVMDRKRLGPGDLVVEFGSNDGTLLRCFARAGLRVQGVDPAVAIAAEASASGVPTRAEFFTAGLAGTLRDELGPAKAVIANNAMANIDDLADVLRGVKAMLAADGTFVFETQYALDVFQRTLLDVIYHEHVSCFSVQPVVRALERYGLEVWDAERIPTKGGSIRFWVQHTGGPEPVAARVAALAEEERREGLYDLDYHRRFGEAVAEIRTGVHRLIADVRQASGRPVGAFGTSVGCAALIHQLALEDKLDMLFDDRPFKDRIEGPGYDLPVFAGADVESQRPGLVVVLAWRYAERIMARHAAYIADGGRFVVPLPRIATVP